MGYWVDQTLRGKVYTVETGAVEPFCNTTVASNAGLRANKGLLKRQIKQKRQLRRQRNKKFTSKNRKQKSLDELI